MTDKLETVSPKLTREPESQNVESDSSRGDTPMANPQVKLAAENLNFYYGSFHALHNVSLGVKERQVTALIGPSGCGKSTFLRTLNRISETIRHTRVEGRISLDGADILKMDVTSLRRRVGMVFQRPTPFPMSIFDNVAAGHHLYGDPGRAHVRSQKALTIGVVNNMPDAALAARQERAPSSLPSPNRDDMIPAQQRPVAKRRRSGCSGRWSGMRRMATVSGT